MNRTATLERTTRETAISVELNLDGQGDSALSTGVGFLDHMLDQLARHGLFDLKLTARGDLHIDAHHTVEDVGIAVGQAFKQALGERRGIRRFGFAYAPLDESLSRVVVDLSNRPSFVWQVQFSSPKIGEFDSELLREWLAGFVAGAAITVHATALYGVNNHHIAESLFKALALALRQACARDADQSGIPSTKGTLSA